MTLSPADYSRPLAVSPSVSNAVDNLWLLGSWDDKNERDREIISRLCGVPIRRQPRNFTRVLTAGSFVLLAPRGPSETESEPCQSYVAHLTGSALQILPRHSVKSSPPSTNNTRCLRASVSPQIF